jgi:hypothetical protein
MRLILSVTMFSAMLAACGSSPTAPTPVTPPVAVVPPVVTPPVAPPVVTPPPAPAFPPTDARFDLAFYRQFVHNALETPNQLQPLRRQTEAPRIYLRTIDNAGNAMDAFTLNHTAAALETTTGALTGQFGVAGVERGTETRVSQRGWITVEWAAEANPKACGSAAVGGNLITLYPRTPGCRCAGGPAVSLSTIKHELGHALGYWHTDSRLDLMYYLFESCDANPSEREKFHAAIAYSRPIGSAAP